MKTLLLFSLVFFSYHCGSVEPAASLGAIGLHMPLTLPDATAVTYTVTASDLFEPVTGTVRLVHGAINDTIDVPSGSARTISLQVLSASGATCLGSATIDVPAGVITNVDLVLTCAEATGSIDVAVDVSNAIDAATLTISATDLSTAITMPLTVTEKHISGHAAQVPVGEHRKVVLEARQAARVVCRGETDVAIVANTAVSLHDVTCQGASGNVMLNVSTNGAPRIHSVTAAGYTLDVSATDPDGDALTYEWTSAAGHITDATAARAVWSPDDATAGSYKMVVRVSDGHASTTGEVTVTIGAPRILISELLVSAEGNDTASVFVELSGPPGTSLNGFSLVGINGGNGATYAKVKLDGFTIGARGYFVIVHPNAKTLNPALFALADATGLVDFQNGPDALALHSGDTTVDVVGYGFGGEGEFAPVPKMGHSLQRVSDTHNNLHDFCETETPTPGFQGPTTCNGKS